jgi:hypothetical protein
MSEYSKMTPSSHTTGGLETFSQPGQPTASQPTSFLGKYNKRTVTIAGLFAFGILCIIVVRMIGQPKLASGQSIADKTADGMVGMLTSGNNPWLSDSRARNAIDNLISGPAIALPPMLRPRGNPFVLEQALQTPSTQPVMVVPDDPKARELQRMTLVADGLHLESILLSDSGPTAVISGKLVTKGQMIEGWCVSEIHPKKVVLTWDGHILTLAIR